MGATVPALLLQRWLPVYFPLFCTTCSAQDCQSTKPQSQTSHTSIECRSLSHRTRCVFPLFCTTHGTQDSRLTKITVIHQLYKCWMPVAFTRQVSIAVQCILQESIHVAALTFMQAHVLSSHANAMMLCELAQGVTLQCLVPHRRNMWTIFGIFMHSYCDSEQTICTMIKMNGVQCLYYVIYLKRMVCNACTMWYTWNEWCAMLVLCVILETNCVQCLYVWLC